MESADTGRDDYGERVATELVRLREAIDEIRRRPVPDVDTLRHVISASLSEASAPPPNLLVTAIRRLDRVDARLEAIEAAVTSQGALPPGGPANRGRGAPAAAAPAPPNRPLATVAGPAVDAEALGDVLARRLGPLISSAPPGRSGGGPSVGDLLAALRPLIPGAARSVLRRGGREPSAQAVDVLQQAAMAALDEAATSLGPVTAQSSPSPSPWAPRPLPPPAPVALPPPPAPPPPAPPPPPPLDVEALAATVAARVTASVTESVARQLTEPQRPAAPPPAPAPSPPSEPRQPTPALDPAAVADLVAARLAEQPPPQALVPAVALVPLVAAVGNVEAAVARLSGPDQDVVGAVTRLEAGVEALARALEEDRAAQAGEVRRAFEEVTELVRDQQPAGTTPAGAQPGDGRPQEAPPGVPEGDTDPVLAAVLDLREQLDDITRQVSPLTQVDLATTVPAIERRGQRLERSIGHILTALAAVADHLSEQASLWRAGVDEQSTTSTDGATGRVDPDAPEVEVPAAWPHDAGAAPAALAEVLTHQSTEAAPDAGAAGPAGPVAGQASAGGSQADPGLAGVVEAAGPLADEHDSGGGSPAAVAVSPEATEEDDSSGVPSAAGAVSPEGTDEEDFAGVWPAAVAASPDWTDEDDPGSGSPAAMTVAPDATDEHGPGSGSGDGVAVFHGGPDEGDAGRGTPASAAVSPGGADDDDAGQGLEGPVAAAPAETEEAAPAGGSQAEPGLVGGVAASGGDERPEDAAAEPVMSQAEPGVVGVVASSGGDERPEDGGAEPVDSQAEPGVVGVVAASGGDERPEDGGAEPVDSQAEPGLVGVVAASGGDERPEDGGAEPVESQAEPGVVGVVAASGGDERPEDGGAEPDEAVTGPGPGDGRDGGADDAAARMADDGGAGVDTEVVVVGGTARRRRGAKSKRRFKGR